METAGTSGEADNDCKVETGVELDGIAEISPLEIFLTAAVGALVGNLLYWVIRNT